MAHLAAIAAVALPMIGGVIGAGEAIRQNNLRNQQLAAQASTAKFNASVAAQNASLAAKETQNNLLEARRRANLQSGAARAQSGGLGVFGGSSLDILDDIASQATYEQQNIVTAGVAKQQSFENQRASFIAESKNANAGKSSGVLAAIGSLVSGFGSGSGNAASLIAAGVL